MHILTKKEKKTARELMAMSIEREFDKALQNSETTLSKWKNKDATAREIFHELNNYLHHFRKHLESRYDGLHSADYLLVIAAILKEGYITEEDVSDFSDEAKEFIKRHNTFL